MRAILLMTAVSILLLVGTSYADELCSDLNMSTVPPEADNLKMFEREFIFERAMKSFEFLGKGVWDLMNKYKRTDEVVDSEEFYISYPNSLTFVKGTVLKQHALIARERLEVIGLKLENGTATVDDKNAAESEFQKAREEFCKFLGAAFYSD